MPDDEFTPMFADAAEKGHFPFASRGPFIEGQRPQLFQNILRTIYKFHFVYRVIFSIHLAGFVAAEKVPSVRLEHLIRPIPYGLPQKVRYGGTDSRESQKSFPVDSK